MTVFGFHTSHHSPTLGAGSPVLEVIAAAGRAGFGAIGVDVGSIEAHVAAGGAVADVRSAIAEAGLICSDLVGFIGPYDDVRVAAERLAALVSDVDAPVCVTVAAPTPREELTAMLEVAAEVLGAAGARLGVEFVPQSGIPTLEAAVSLCAALGWSRAGVVLDPFHHFVGGTDLAEVRALRGSDIALVQCCDALTATPVERADSSRNGRKLPGEGVLPLAEWAAAVRSTGYGGVVASEVLSAEMRGWPPDVSATRCFDALANLWHAAGG